MARKQFVSSKKNAPSRAVSSKEAALRGRADDDEDDEDVESEAEEDVSMNGGGDSPASSVASSPISSDDDGGDDEDDDNDKDGADPVEDGVAVVAVQVMPASVGRGKQLRFPTAISRGKEARILHNGSDREGSDSEESYASVASDEEEEPDNDAVVAAAAMTSSQEAPIAISQETNASPSRSQSPSPSRSPLAAAADDEEAVSYPIKAFRARKRHRPDSGYFAQMSTHVRDCLLSIRDVGASDALSEDAHHEFRRKLSAGSVERVPWKQVSPPPPAAAPSDSEKKVPKSSPSRDAEKRQTKDEKECKSTPRKSSSRKNGDDRSERRAEKSSQGDADASEARKKDRSGKENNSGGGSRREEKESKRSVDAKDSKDRSERSKSSKSKSKSSSTSASSTSLSKRAEANGNGASRVELGDPLCAKCKESVREQNADEEKRKAAVEASAAAVELQAKAAQAQLDAAAASKPQVASAAVVAPVPTGSFIVPTNAARDIVQMREEAARLNDEARSLKHEGNRYGTADPGQDGQVAQGRFYLRSSAKFFQHALLLADIKAAYREAGDERHARSYGDFSVQTLAQTSSLIESTVRKLRSAGNRRLVALGYKLASIVELTIYRLQHVKLFSLYSDLYTPGRSPDTRQNGTTPPINGAGSDSQDSAVKTLLLKEMEHTLRGFDMWQRYESCRVEVLPRVSNPAVVDTNVLFEDLETELSRANPERA